MTILRDHNERRTGISSETWSQMRRELDITDQPIARSPSLSINPDIIWRVLDTQIIIANTVENYKGAQNLAHENGCRLMHADEIIRNKNVIDELPEGHYWAAADEDGYLRQIVIDHKKENMWERARISDLKEKLDMLLVPLRPKVEVSMQDWLELIALDWQEVSRLQQLDTYYRAGPEISVLLSANFEVAVKQTQSRGRLPNFTEIERLLRNDPHGEYWVELMDGRTGERIPVSAVLDSDTTVKLEEQSRDKACRVALVRSARQ